MKKSSGSLVNGNESSIFRPYFIDVIEEEQENNEDDQEKHQLLLLKLPNSVKNIHGPNDILISINQ